MAEFKSRKAKLETQKERAMNMSYVRFTNTASDFAECLDTLQQACSDGHCESITAFKNTLADDRERYGFDRLCEMARAFCDVVEELDDQ